MYKSFVSFLVLLVSVSAFARPSCLITGECMEYNGKIIDLRSKAAQMYQDSLGCDALVENCLVKKTHETTILSAAEFKKLTAEGGSEFFIPIDFRKQDQMILATALSLGVVVFANDQAIMDHVQENKMEEMQKAIDFGNLLGSTNGMVSIAAGSYFIGAVMNNGKLKNVGLFTLGAGLATQLVTEIFKNTFRRVRPNTAENPYQFFEDGKSFFSGHTSAAFSLATVVAEIYKDKPVVPYLAYGVAALTAYSRMYDKKHWGSDIIAGAVAGHLVTKLFMRMFDESDSSVPSGLIFVPEFSRDLAGNARYSVQVTWRPGYKKGPSKCTTMGLEGEALVKACFDEALNN